MPQTDAKLQHIAAGWLTWPRARQAIQTMVAAVLAYIVATYFELPQGYWSVMTAILVVQSSVGASLGLAFDRLMATVLGAAFGGLLVVAFGELKVPLLALSVMSLAYVATFRPSLRLAPVTAAIVVLTDPHYGSPAVAAVHRVLEIGIGASIAILVSLVLFPSRAGAALAHHVAKTLPNFATHLADTIDAALGKVRIEDDILALNARVRAALNAGEGLVAEARRELAGHIADHADPAAVLRTLRRLWYTLAMASRAARTPLPTEVAMMLAPALREVSSSAQDVMAQLAAIYGGEPIVPDIGHVEAAVSKYDAAMAAVRQSGALRPMPTEDAARIFALAFALGQLPENLKDLLDRYRDLTGVKGATANDAA